MESLRMVGVHVLRTETAVSLVSMLGMLEGVLLWKTVSDLVSPV